MRAVAHGWKPSRMKSPPSRAVAREFVDADKKYSGGFAENRYGRGGLAAMGEVDAGSERQRPLNQLHFQRGGRRGGRRTNGGGGTPTTTSPPPPAPVTYPWGSEAGTTQDMLGRMGYSGPMGYIGVVSGLRQAGWTAAPGSDPSDLRNTMWYPPEDTFTGGGGPGGPSAPPPRIIPTDPTSYVGGTTSGTSGGGGGGSSGEGSEYRKDLRKHQRRIENILGSARGGHVNYYEEGGAVRPGHAEGANPHDPVKEPAAYRYWESRFHKDPPPPPEVAAAPAEEEGGVGSWLRGLFIDDPETANIEAIERGIAEGEGQAYGGRVRYQAGGLAIAAPAGGVPPWISPTGTGPGYMDEPPPGYQFGGIADRLNPPAAAPAPVGMAAPPAAAVGPPGGLAAMQQQQSRAGDAMARMGGPRRASIGRLPPGIDPRAVAANPQGWAQQQAEMRRRELGGPGGGQQVIGDFGGTMGPDVISDYWGPPGGPGDPMTPRGPMAPGGRPFMPRVSPWNRPGPVPERFGGSGKPRPGPGGIVAGEGIPGGGNIPPWKRPPGGRRAPPPGKYPMGDERGPGGSGPFNPGPVGGPRVPPNMRGYLQKQRMMNRPPSGPVGGGGGNRVGMADQQGALSRAMQRGTGRPPMSRRSAFGRAQ